MFYCTFGGDTVSTKITFTNSRGQSCELTTKTSKFILTGLSSGLGEVAATFQTQKAPYQAGSTLTGISLGERSIEIEVLIRGEDKEEISRNRMELSKVFDPLTGEGELLYQIDEVTVYKIKCVPDAFPTYPTGKGVRTAIAQRASLSLTAHDPYWLDQYMKETSLYAFDDPFNFPHTFPVSFNTEGPSQTIYNTGHVDVPFIARLSGPNAEPTLKNLTTGEFMRISYPLEVTQTLVINTTPGNKKVYTVDNLGKTKNVIGFMDPDSVFFQLQIGENEITYNTLGEPDEEVALIQWSQRYNSV